jgi:hypothetical protein
MKDVAHGSLLLLVVLLPPETLCFGPPVGLLNIFPSLIRSAGISSSSLVARRLSLYSFLLVGTLSNPHKFDSFRITPPFILATRFRLPFNLLTATMSRILALRRGKAGDVQSFSKARAPDPAKVALIEGTLRPATDGTLRIHVLSDTANVHQFACSFGDVVGYLTRPTIVLSEGIYVVTGNFTDTIGEPFPCSIPIEEFEGHFTTLVRRSDAEKYGFAIHPKAPDTVKGAARNVAASMERLNFVMPDEPEDGDRPVIAALPLFLPVGPGQTFPHLLATADPQSFRDTFPLFEVWRQGIAYAKTHNASLSVTVGGPLFSNTPLVIDPEDVTSPFNWIKIRAGIPRSLTQLVPGQLLYAKTRDRLLTWSEVIWVEVGGNVDAEEPAPPLPPAAAGNFFTPEHFRAALEPLVPKEKTFTSAGRTSARYRLLLAAKSPPGGGNPDEMMLPDLRDEFKAYLSIPGNASAGEELRELIKSRLSVANALETSLDRDVTLEAENITLAFSDRMRIFGFLSEKLINTTHIGAKGSLGLLHLLTPDRSALAAVLEGEQEAAALLMSNSSSSTAQLDASKASKLYCLGRLTTFRHSYEAICNFRCLVSVMVEDLALPLVLEKLLEYSSLLVDRTGRLFFESYNGTSHLAVHPWQDLQTILSAFCRIAMDSTLHAAVSRGEPVASLNYQSAIDVSDALISELRAILNGNGLGKFAGIPTCSSWFPRVSSAPGVSPPSTPSAGGDLKRQKMQVTPPSGIAKPPVDLEHRKALGVLQFDAAAAGSSRLPSANIYHKKRGSSTGERLCMKFLIRGFACDSTDCKLPHVSNVDSLPPAVKAKLIEFVRKQPGLSWVEGKAPAGTS